MSGAFVSAIGLVTHPDGAYYTSKALLCMDVESEVDKVNN